MALRWPQRGEQLCVCVVGGVCVGEMDGGGLYMWGKWGCVSLCFARFPKKKKHLIQNVQTYGS